MKEDAISGFITLFEAGHVDVVFSTNANDIAESLGGKRCINPHDTNPTAALFYLLALIASDRSSVK